MVAGVENGRRVLSFGAASVQRVKGAVLLVAVGIDAYNKQQGRPSVIGFLTKKRTPAGEFGSVETTPIGARAMEQAPPAAPARGDASPQTSPPDDSATREPRSR